MGVLNVTPDSFSDGGRYDEPRAATAHAAELLAAGAEILDVGGESTRPGAQVVSVAEETQRVVPVVGALSHATVSVDTTKAAVAAAALDAGAVLVNDISAGRADPDMLAVTADHDAGFVAMHMQGTPATMQDDPRYDDVVREVGDFLLARLDAARAAGVRDDALLADPGIGFGKTVEHNLELLAALGTLVQRLEVPIVIGASRKWFLGVLTGTSDASDREEATLATTVLAFDAGVRVVRVHEVAPSVRAARLLAAMEHAA